MRSRNLAIMFISFIMLFSMFTVVSVKAPSAKYWFFSHNPCPNFYDPETGDPNYVGSSTDEWLKEGVVQSIDCTSFAGTGTPVEFSFWLGVKNSDSTNTKLVISINDDAYNGIEQIRVRGGSASWTTISSWTTSASPPGAVTHPVLSGHGVFNSAEFWGYYDLAIGDISESETGSGGACNVIRIDFEVTVKAGTNQGMKIHLDAYGDEGSGPYSHDATAVLCSDIPPFVVPEFPFGTIIALIGLVTALAMYKSKQILTPNL